MGVEPPQDTTFETPTILETVFPLWSACTYHFWWKLQYQYTKGVGIFQKVWRLQFNNGTAEIVGGWKEEWTLLNILPC